MPICQYCQNFPTWFNILTLKLFANSRYVNNKKSADIADMKRHVPNYAVGALHLGLGSENL